MLLWLMNLGFAGGTASGTPAEPARRNSMLSARNVRRHRRRSGR